MLKVLGVFLGCLCLVLSQPGCSAQEPSPSQTAAQSAAPGPKQDSETAAKAAATKAEAAKAPATKAEAAKVEAAKAEAAAAKAEAAKAEAATMAEAAKTTADKAEAAKAEAADKAKAAKAAADKAEAAKAEAAKAKGAKAKAAKAGAEAVKAEADKAEEAAKAAKTAADKAEAAKAAAAKLETEAKARAAKLEAEAKAAATKAEAAAKAADNERKFQALVTAAQFLLEAGDYDNALKQAEEALKLDIPDDSSARELGDVLGRILRKKSAITSKQQELQARDAKRLTDQHDFAAASTKLQELIPKITDPQVLAKAEEAWKNNQLGFFYNCWIHFTNFATDFWGIIKYLVYAALLLGLIYGLVRLLGWAVKKYKTCRKLQFHELNDTTDLSLDELFVSYLYQLKERQEAAGSGILRLELPRTTFLLGTVPKEQLTVAFEKLPTAVGQVPLSEMGRFFSAVQRWLALCPPWVSTTFTWHEESKDDKKKQIIQAQVILQRLKDKVVLLASWPEPDPDEAPAASPHDKAALDPAAAGKPAPPGQEGDAGAADPPSAPPALSPEAQAGALLQAAKRGAESLAFKTFYLLLHEQASAAQADEFERLRQGMILLNRYLSGGEFHDLDRSQRIFTSVRTKYPLMLAAYLYEGFALDLLQDHDQAAGNFRFVKEQATYEDNQALCQRAAYNEAIAYLHTFTYEGLNQALRLLQELLGPYRYFFRPSSLMAMAYYAQARVLAQLPRFWPEVFQQLQNPAEGPPTPGYQPPPAAKLLQWQQEILTGITFRWPAGPQELVDYDNWQIEAIAAGTRLLSRTLQEATRNLTDILAEVNRVLQGTSPKTPPPPARSFPEWTRSDCRHLEWAIHNAWAHFYLNCAIGLLDNPSWAPGAESEAQNFLAQAWEEFQRCNLLRSPRFETWADLGTLFLYRRDYQTAREYLQKAAELNRNYEYAFYRLAQTYEQEKDYDQVRKTLADFQKYRTPRLQPFQQMYAQYAGLLMAPSGPEPKLVLWYPL